MNKSIFIFSGEQSADNHGALLARAIKKNIPDVKLTGVGGIALKDAGVDIIRDNSDLSVVGIIEVLKHYNKFRNLLNSTEQYIKDKSIDLVILIDYPGFNLRLAKLLEKQSCKVVYYISPQLWAWGKNRIKIVKQCIDHVIVIFKFEELFYREHNVSVSYVGHPLLDNFNEDINTKALRDKIKLDSGKKIIVFLPGSRKVEIQRLIPEILNTIRKLSQTSHDFQFVISAASTMLESEINQAISAFKWGLKQMDVKVYAGDINPLIKVADFVVVASGTASLQVAIHQKPMVVIYKINMFSYYILKKMITIPYVSIVNIIADKMVVPELIQNKCNHHEISKLVIEYFENDEYKERMKKDLVTFKTILGSSGASDNAAKIIKKLLDE